MRLVLSDKDLSAYEFPDDVEYRKITDKELKNYNGNTEVVAIAGSRAMAIETDKMVLPSLKLFQLTSAGFDSVPLQSYEKKGIYVANAGSVYSVPIAETVIFGMLLMAKRLRKNPNDRRFKLFRGYTEICELKSKKVLIMGAGNIGTAIAKRLGGFEMQVDGYDPYCLIKPEYEKILRTREELIISLAEYDYIISTMPDTEQTQKFINADLFSAMKNTAVIINVGRRSVFDEDEFYVALKSEKIGGAVLDMFEKIPNPITNKFRRLSNVVVLPGVAAISQEVNVRLKEHMYKNIKSLLSGESIVSVINGVL